MKKLIASLIFWGLILNAEASTLTAGDKVAIKFDSLELIGANEYGAQTSISYNYYRKLESYTLTLDGGMIQTLETNLFDISLYEDANQTIPDYSFTVANQESLGNVFVGLSSLGGVNNTQFWGDLNGLITINILEGNVYLDSIDVSVDLPGKKYARSFALTTVPVPSTVWLFGSGLFCLIGVARKKYTRG